MKRSFVINFQYAILFSAIALIAWAFYEEGFRFTKAFFADTIFALLLIIISVGTIIQYKKQEKNEN